MHAHTHKFDYQTLGKEGASEIHDISRFKARRARNTVFYDQASYVNPLLYPLSDPIITATKPMVLLFVL